jgi:MFS family permease
MDGQRRTGIFVSIWLGQLVSLFGAQLSKFALGIWVFEQSRSTTDFALITFAPMLVQVLVLPLAGSLVDRWDRRRIMLACDVAEGLATATLLALLLTGRLQVWHIWVAAGLASLFYNFRFLAFTALTTVLVPREQLQRASAVAHAVPMATQALAPLVSGALLGSIGIRGILLIDLATFLVALLPLLLVRVPAVVPSAGELAPRPSLLRDSTYGWHFLRARAGLLSLLRIDAVFQGVRGLLVLFAPLVLSLSDARMLGRLQFVGAVAMGLGGVLASAWRGAREPVRAVLLLVGLQGGGLLVLGLSGASLTLIGAAAFLYYLAVPLLLGTQQAIWLRKIPAEVQGRVLAVRTMASQLAGMAALLLAGPLADRVFQPLLARGGMLATLVAPEAGGGARAVFLLAGVAVITHAGLALLHPRLRRLEQEVPDAASPAPVEPALPR